MSQSWIEYWNRILNLILNNLSWLFKSTVKIWVKLNIKNLVKNYPILQVRIWIFVRWVDLDCDNKMNNNRITGIIKLYLQSVDKPVVFVSDKCLTDTLCRLRSGDKIIFILYHRNCSSSERFWWLRWVDHDLKIVEKKIFLRKNVKYDLKLFVWE